MHSRARDRNFSHNFGRESERCCFGLRFSVASLGNLADFATEIHFGREKPEHANAPIYILFISCRQRKISYLSNLTQWRYSHTYTHTGCEDVWLHPHKWEPRLWTLLGDHSHQHTYTSMHTLVSIFSLSLGIPQAVIIATINQIRVDEKSKNRLKTALNLYSEYLTASQLQELFDIYGKKHVQHDRVSQ